MNTTSTHFVQTNLPTSSQPITSTITVWPNGDQTAPLANPSPRGHGVCPSCGRCRECGRPADDGWRFVPVPQWPWPSVPIYPPRPWESPFSWSGHVTMPVDSVGTIGG